MSVLWFTESHKTEILHQYSILTRRASFWCLRPKFLHEHCLGQLILYEDDQWAGLSPTQTGKTGLDLTQPIAYGNQYGDHLFTLFQNR